MKNFEIRLGSSKGEIVGEMKLPKIAGALSSYKFIEGAEVGGEGATLENGDIVFVSAWVTVDFDAHVVGIQVMNPMEGTLTEYAGQMELDSETGTVVIPEVSNYREVIKEAMDY